MSMHSTVKTLRITQPEISVMELKRFLDGLPDGQVVRAEVTYFQPTSTPILVLTAEMGD